MKTRTVVLLIWFFYSMSSFAQDRLDNLISEATQNYSKGEYNIALVQAHEAYELSVSESRKFETCRSSLLLSEIYRESNQFNEALEFGLRSKNVSSTISSEYFIAGNLSLINLFGKWGAWDKQLEYIDALLIDPIVSPELMGDLIELKSRCLYNLGRYNESAPLLNETITRYREAGDLEKSFSKIMDMAVLERKRGESNSAIMYLMSLTTPEYSSLSKADYGIVENNIGELFLDQGKFQNALEHLSIAVRNVTSSDQGYSLVLVNLAMTYYKMDDYELALVVLDKAIAKSTVSGEWHNLSLAQALKAKMLSSKGDLSGSLEAAYIALNAAEKSGEARLLADVYLLLGNIHLKNGDEEQAQDYQKRSKDLSVEIDLYNQNLILAQDKLIHTISSKERSILSRISAAEAEKLKLETELAAAKRDKDLTQLKYEKELQDAALINEQVAKERAIKELALVQAALMTEQQRFTIVELEKAKTNEQLKVSQLSNLQSERERGIVLLKKENELLNSEQQRKEMEFQKDAALKKSGIVLIVFISLLLLLSLIAFFSTKRKNREIKRNQEALNAFNIQLKEKNHEITSSIVFAKNFQELIVPSEDSFREAFPNSFLIYQPMDIVSGDIPFILNREDKLYVGAIDCTGHGVPAAMQSFMVYYNLTELIREYPTDSCADLLQMLHNKLSISTNNTKEERSFAAGVDIGLCCISKSTLELEFSGANQPLIHLSKNGIEKIQGDRFTVGDTSNKNAVKFTNQVKQLSLGDRIYLLSDGFVHQFGGLEGKQKYSSKRLLNELAAEKVSSHIRVKMNLEESLKAWKGDSDQTDDIMLIGLEISEPIILK